MKKSENKSFPKHYDSLDAPVFVWSKIHETGDVSYLLIKRVNVTEEILKKLETVWENIYDEYIRVFGLSEAFLAIKKKEIEVALLKLKFIITNNRKLLTLIDIEQEILDDMRGNISKADFMESKIAIENRFKFQINMQQTTIREFYSYLKHLK